MQNVDEMQQYVQTVVPKLIFSNTHIATMITDYLVQVELFHIIFFNVCELKWNGKIKNMSTEDII